jgi:dimethylhistidine N-methyltransferase
MSVNPSSTTVRMAPDLRAQLLGSAHAAAPTIETAASGDFAHDLLAALTRRPRSISPKYFYDAPGSALFDRICELPEYYPTRTEIGLLQRFGPEMAECIGPGADLVEFGAGSNVKIRCLLQALHAPRRFIPIDISAEHLMDSARALQGEYPGLQVRPLAADFTRPFELPPPLPLNGHGTAPRVGFFPGSSLGNFTPVEARGFLRRASALLRGGGLLIGIDLVKDPAVLHAAYNDAQGVTAAFNLNLLARANRELGTDFDLAAFDHYAFYQPVHQRIEMHLVARHAQHVHLAGRRFDFAAGDSLHTEYSYKYTVEGFRALAAESGFAPEAVWCDPDRLFSVHWLRSTA